MDIDRDIALGLFDLLAGTLRRMPADLSRTAVATLSTLAVAGPHRITDLAAAQKVTQPSMTVLVGRLESAGYVERRSDAADRRVSLVALTEQGTAYLADRRARGADILAGLIGRLDEADVSALAAALPAIRRLRALEAEEEA